MDGAGCDQPVTREQALYGVLLEPLQLSLVTGVDNLSLERSVLGYQVWSPSWLLNTRLVCFYIRLFISVSSGVVYCYLSDKPQFAVQPIATS